MVRRNPSWQLLRREFRQWAAQSIRNPSEYERDLDHIEAFRPIRSVREIDPAFIVEYRDWRLASGHMRAKDDGTPTPRKVTPRTVNKEITTLQNLLNKAVKWGRIVKNPIAGMKPLRHDSPTKVRRALTIDEINAIVANSPEHLKPVWRMYCLVGVRFDELVEMKFADVDFDRRTVTVHATTAKNGKPREIPLDDDMLATIHRLKDEAAARQPIRSGWREYADRQVANFSREHVFVSKVNTPLRNNLLTRFYVACRKAGIEDGCTNGSVDIHALRMSFASLAVASGANPKSVQEILGHSTVEMTMRDYVRADDDDKRKALPPIPSSSTKGSPCTRQND